MDIITQNGNNSVTIKAAGFQNVINLKKAVAKCLLDVGIVKDLDFKGFNIPNTMDKIIQFILKLELSQELNSALFECLKSSYINENGVKLKITPQLFDEKPELREDYYEIISKCLEENLRPFFKSLVTEFKTRLNQAEKILPSESPQELNG